MTVQKKPRPALHVAGARSPAKTESSPTSGPADRAQWVAMAAYYRAERRNFAAGNELEDWLAAEREFDELL
jgi:Protein of unknown function (DUF2934)